MTKADLSRIPDTVARWRAQDGRRSQMQRAVLMEVYARFFRRFGRRIWIEEAA